MIICHQYRFIFIHCRKTGGSSIARALAPCIGPEDLHLGTWPEALACGVRPNAAAWRDLHSPRAAGNFFLRLLRRPAALINESARVAALNGAQRKAYPQLGPSPEHAPAAALRAFDPDSWRDYYKFCFVRNPYQRAVSDYLWRCRKHGVTGLTFLDYLRRLESASAKDPLIPRQWDNWPMYTIDDHIAVDRVGRFENLAADFADICTTLRLPEATARLPHEKAGGGSQDYRDFYCSQSRALVRRLYAREIDHFGYTF